MALDGGLVSDLGVRVCKVSDGAGIQFEKFRQKNINQEEQFTALF